IKDSPRPLIAADMVLVRIGFAADLPTPGEALRKLMSATTGQTPDGPQNREAEIVSRAPLSAENASLALASAPPPNAALPSIALSRFEDIVALAGRHRDIQLKLALERDVRLVRFEQGRIEFSVASGASPRLAHTLMSRLQEWTGSRWLVAVSSTPGAPSLKEQEEAKAREILTGVHFDPLVQSVLAAFPGAEIVGVRTNKIALENPLAAGTDNKMNDEIGFHDDLDDDP
ncbi:MAG TPA: DNA polymerase III subunit gamma/tau, partial [Methylocella sp.]|nr:DNA polymerase III subunit gamma/tau [Methylocella sp.]